MNRFLENISLLKKKRNDMIKKQRIYSTIVPDDKKKELKVNKENNNPF